MRYALISAGVVVDVIRSDEDPGGDWVACGDAAPGWIYDAESNEFSPITNSPPPVYEWHIDVGPFLDRFGFKSFAVDASTDPFVRSFSIDVNSRRKWINLREPRVMSALAYLAGQTIPMIGTIAAPILTLAEVDSILNTPVREDENLALRKMYFS